MKWSFRVSVNGSHGHWAVGLDQCSWESKKIFMSEHKCLKVSIFNCVFQLKLQSFQKHSDPSIIYLLKGCKFFIFPISSAKTCITTLKHGSGIMIYFLTVSTDLWLWWCCNHQRSVLWWCLFNFWLNLLNQNLTRTWPVTFKATCKAFLKTRVHFVTKTKTEFYFIFFF